MHEPNDLYDTTFRLFTLQSPFRMGKTQHAIDLCRTTVCESRRQPPIFSRKYDAILASHDEQQDMLASVRGTPYRRVERLFYEYIRAQRAEASSMLDRLSEIEKQEDGSKSR